MGGAERLLDDLRRLDGHLPSGLSPPRQPVLSLVCHLWGSALVPCLLFSPRLRRCFQGLGSCLGCGPRRRRSDPQIPGLLVESASSGMEALWARAVVLLYCD